MVRPASLQRPARPRRAMNSAPAGGRRAGPAAAEDDAVRLCGLPARPLHAAAGHARAHHGLRGHCHLAVCARAALAPRSEGPGRRWAPSSMGLTLAAAVCSAPCSGTVGRPMSATLHAPLRLSCASLQRTHGRPLANPAAQHRSVSVRSSHPTAWTCTARGLARGGCSRYRRPARARYTAPAAYDAAFAAARGALLDAFLGPPACGVYSPSVQFTLFQMGRLLLERCGRPHTSRRCVICRICCPTRLAARRPALSGVLSRVALQICLCRGSCTVRSLTSPCLSSPPVRGCAGLPDAAGALHLPTMQCPINIGCPRDRVAQADSVFLNMPNLHFLPCSPVISKVRA